MVRTIFAAAAACFIAGCVTAPDPAAIVAAERAFAADGYATGIKASFMAHAAPDAVIFAPGPVNVHAHFSAQPDAAPDPSRPHLVWWPLWTGISASDDLGFTSGPYAYDDDRRGYYFTIWQKQAGGDWKWVLDAGVEADASAAPGPGSMVQALPVATAGSVSADTAFSDVMKLEAAGTGEYAPTARLHAPGLAPATDAASRQAARAARPAGIALTPLGGGASGAGDLVWTYAEATGGDAAAPGGYLVHVWQKHETGWKIVFDELVPAQ
jgi:ketosteroid isomerase-like protein